MHKYCLPFVFRQKHSNQFKTCSCPILGDNNSVSKLPLFLLLSLQAFSNWWKFPRNSNKYWVNVGSHKVNGIERSLCPGILGFTADFSSRRSGSKCIFVVAILPWHIFNPSIPAFCWSIQRITNNLLMRWWHHQRLELIKRWDCSCSECPGNRLCRINMHFSVAATAEQLKTIINIFFLLSTSSSRLVVFCVRTNGRHPFSFPVQNGPNDNWQRITFFWGHIFS